MIASGEKVPVPDAPPMAPDFNAQSPAEKNVPGVLKTSGTANHDLVVQAISNKNESLKLMGSIAQKSAPKNATLAAKPSNTTKPQATAKTESKADSTEFEKDFVDVDEDQDEGSRPPGKEEKLQTEASE